jgi:hypothetical protein
VQNFRKKEVCKGRKELGDMGADGRIIVMGLKEKTPAGLAS